MKFKALRKKAEEFVIKHGMTGRSYFLATLLFPPGAIYITYKHPVWSRPVKFFAFLFIVVFLAAIPILGKYTVSFLYGIYESLN